MRRLAVLLAVVALFALSGEAGAATAIPIGTGVDPNVVLDGAGTAYIAWNGDEVSNSTIRFCKLPRGADVCSVATTITDPAHNSLSRPFLFVSGATIRIVQYRYGADPGLFEFSSVNGGGTFGAARKVGTAVFDDAVVGPGNTMSGVTNAVTGGTFFQNVAVDGTSPTQTTQANLSADRPYAGAIALLGNLPFVVYDDGSAQAQFRHYDGSGPINDAANWTAAVDIGYTDSPSLASGPLGLFMLSGTQTNAMTVRRFDGATFAAPVEVLPSGEDVQSWLTQDPAGRLHAVIPQGAADGLHLVHATSDDGAVWRSGTALVQTDGGIAGVRSAVAADHVGVTVWSTATANGKVIRVAAIGPDAPVDLQPAGGSTNPPPGGSNNPPPATRRAAGLPSAKHPPAVARRLANGDVRVAVKGVIRRPAGVSKARGCRGKVGVRFKRGKRAIGSKTITLSRQCVFKRVVRFKRAQMFAARRLTMTLAFKGNAAVAPAKKTYRLPIKGRR